MINSDPSKMKIRIVSYSLLIIFNLLSLYFIVGLFSYDEMEGYLHNDEKYMSPLRCRAYLLYITSLLNLYFLSYKVIKKTFEE